MSDNKPKEEDGKEEDSNFVPSLDQVHELAVEAVENEERENEEEAEQPADKEPESGDEPDTKDEEVVEEDKPEEKRPEPTPEVKEEAAPIQTPEENIPKVKIKDSDGKEHEFGSTEDIPDDFEPDTYKSFAVATAKLAQREIAVEKARADAATKKIEADRVASIDKIKESWDKDLATLVENGDIPKGDDQKEVVDGIYRVMQEELNAGRPANSFAQAYELYQYREGIKAQNESKAKKAEEKKKRGSKVFGSGGANPSPSNNRGKVFEAPPAGVSLDQVHDKILNSL